VVLLHGLGNSLDYWTAVLPIVSETHRTIALDIPGFGRSLAPSGSYTAASVAEVIATVLKKLRVTSAHVVGHSLGAIVGMELVIHRPANDSHLTLVDGTLFRAGKLLSHLPAVVFHPKLSVNLAAQFAGALIPMVSPVRQMFSSSFVREALLWPFVFDPKDLSYALLNEALMDNKGGAGALRVLRIGHSLDLTLLASLVKCDVGIIWGEHDRLIDEIDISEARRLFNVTSVETIAACAHWPMLEQPVVLGTMLLAQANRAKARMT
jgi:pimeloyl-ACP methyl ester carboxylesterase